MYFFKNKNSESVSSIEEWNNLSNWWTDNTFSQNAENIPIENSNISIYTNINKINFEKSYNLVKIYCEIFNTTIICTECIFYGNSKFYEGNCINANKVTFMQNSVNAGYISADTYFMEDSYAEDSSIIGDCLIKKTVFVSSTIRPLSGQVVGENIIYN